MKNIIVTIAVSWVCHEAEFVENVQLEDDEFEFLCSFLKDSEKTVSDECITELLEKKDTPEFVNTLHEKILDLGYDYAKNEWYFCDEDNEMMEDSLRCSFEEDLKSGKFNPKYSLQEYLDDNDLDDEQDALYDYFDESEVYEEYMDFLSEQSDEYYAEAIGLDLDAAKEYTQINYAISIE